MKTATIRLAVLALTVFSLSACGGDAGSSDSGASDEAKTEAPVDAAAWEAELEAVVGHPVGDFATVREIAEEACAESESDFGLAAAVYMDAGDETLFRTNVTYACPERTSEIDAVVLDGANMDRICSEGATTEDEELMVEAMGC